MAGPDEETTVGRQHFTSHGDGEDMRIGPVRWNGLTSGGARFIIRQDPQQVLGAAVQQLQSAGFALGDDTFQQKLTASGSEWLAQDLRLGDVKKSWKRGAVEWLVDGTGLEFFPRFWRGATPTLVAAAARAAAEGSELVIYPHVSIRGGSDGNDAYPLVRQAVAALDERFTREGLLVSREKLRGIKNDGSPASQKVVKDLLGWR